MSHQPSDPNYANRIRTSFAQQRVMATIGAGLTRVEPGLVEIALPFDLALTQHHGFLHAGIVTTIVDSACGYAAYTLMPAEAEVLSVEFKINLLAPARGDRFLARGQVVRAGRTLTVCQGEVLAYTDVAASSAGSQADPSEPSSAAAPIPVAAMQATMMALVPAPRPSHSSV